MVAVLADTLGLRVPRQVLVLVDDHVSCEDPDPELVALVRASAGMNLGFEVLDGARDLRAYDLGRIRTDEASAVLWLDGLVMNPDRTARNPNLMLRGDELWLIDHGAALAFHHDWARVTEDTPRRAAGWPAGHALASRAVAVEEWDPILAAALGRDALRAAVRAVPDAFLLPLLASGPEPAALVRRREAYVAFLWKRLKAPRRFAARSPHA
jgi:hypothetical protein